MNWQFRGRYSRLAESRTSCAHPRGLSPEMTTSSRTNAHASIRPRWLHDQSHECAGAMLAIKTVRLVWLGLSACEPPYPDRRPCRM